MFINFKLVIIYTFPYYINDEHYFLPSIIISITIDY
jgi:hypothetical protein